MRWLALILFTPPFAVLVWLYWQFPRSTPRTSARRRYDVVALLVCLAAANAAGSALEAARSELSAQELAVQQALEGAWRQYEITLTQVSALENGILREAEAALKVAEAAYRFGERGILDYLDAQRVFRIARNELIAARYDLQLAVIEIERLRAAQPWSGATP